MQITPKTREAYQLLHEGMLALARTEQNGLRIDMDYVDRKTVHLTRKIDRLEEIFKQSEFFKEWQRSTDKEVNIHSGSQLGDFLYKVKKMKPEKYTDSGLGSTDNDTLLNLGIPELETLLSAKKLKKVKDTYLASFAREQVNGYLHPFFNLHIVPTYRSSSSNPNFQNIPKRDEESMQLCRGAIFPRPGHQLMEVDTSGMEVRIAACYHKDTTMLKYIRDPHSDMHGDMAKQIFMVENFDKNIPEHYVLRQAAKNGFVFPEFYGDYYKNCAKYMACAWGKLSQGRWSAGQGIAMPQGTLADHFLSVGIKSLEAFANHLKVIEKDFWNVRFTEYTEWKEEWWSAYQKYGYFTMLTGFQCSGIMNIRQATNFPVQGAAFHCLLWVLIQIDRIQREEKWDSRLVGQIHDSLVLDVLPSEAEHVYKTIKRVMGEDLVKHWDWIIVPIDVDAEISPVDCSWAEKEKYKI